MGKGISFLLWVITPTAIASFVFGFILGILAGMGIHMR